MVDTGERVLVIQSRIGRRRGRRVLVASALLAAGVAAGAPTVAGGVTQVELSGAFAETAAGVSAGYEINGSARMVVGPTGTTVDIVVGGLDPAKAYGSHLHNGTCAAGGGAHYQDVEGGATTPPNELWIVSSGTTLSPGANSIGSGTGSASWAARLGTTSTNAASVVLHEPGGARIACADLPGTPTNFGLRGVFAETTAGATAGYDINGSASMVIGTIGTAVSVQVTGLDPAKAYGSHLHNGTCASGGGGHYQDVAGGDTTPPNELWVANIAATLVSGSDGVATASGTATWQARLSGSLTTARSIIVHEPGGARIACADLRTSEPSGPFARMSGTNGAIARLYVAVFHRDPDIAGHAYWVGQANRGVKLRDIGWGFVASSEFVQTYARLDDSAFVNLLYANVLNRQGEAAGVTYWKGILTNGTDRADVLLNFSESSEFRNVTKTG